MMLLDCAIQVEISKCKNRCIFCSPDGVDYPVNMDEKIVSIYNQAISLRKTGLTRVEISGHDPIEFDRITGLVAWLKKIGFEMVVISTHGRNLCDIDFARKLIGCGVDAFRISLYGSTAKVHDSVTLSAGSFDETVKGLRNLNKLKRKTVELRTLILKQNVDDLKALVDLCSSFDAIGLRVDMPFMSVKKNVDSFCLSYSQLREKETLKSLFSYCNEKLPYQFFINGYPFCLLGFQDERVVDSAFLKPGINYEVQKGFKSEVRGIPEYRLKEKLEICHNCTAKNCGGFLKTYIEHFGIDDITGFEPIKGA